MCDSAVGRTFWSSGNPPYAFLAGGITGCEEWQAKVVEALKDEPVLLINPRRANFPVEDKHAAFDQIKWEFSCLALADRILFWFAKEQIQPIVLYEFGRWLALSTKPLFVGVHPAYPRRQDVYIQGMLAYSSLEISSSLDALIWRVKNNLRQAQEFGK